MNSMRSTMNTFKNTLGKGAPSMDANSRMFSGTKTNMTKRNNLGEYESTIGNGDTFLKSRQKQPGQFGGLNSHMNKKKKLTQT